MSRLSLSPVRSLVRTSDVGDLGPSTILVSPDNYQSSHFDYLAQEVEDHSGNRVHMSTNPVIGDW